MDRRFRDMLMMDYATKNTGGLLSGTQTATGGLLGGLSNISPELLIGSQIIGEGLKGTDPFSSVVPAVLQTAQIQKALRPKQAFQLLSDKEKQFLGLPQDRQFQKDPETGKISQVGGSQVSVNLNQGLSQGISVANQYQKESDEFIKRNNSRNQILALTDTKSDRTAQEDFDLVYAYYKFLDPGSTVRETEFANLEKLGSVGRRIAKIIPKWTKGRLLSNDQVNEIRNSMNQQFQNFSDEQKQRYNRFSTILNENNLNPDLFLQSYIPKEKQKSKKKDYSEYSTEELLKMLNEQ